MSVTAIALLSLAAVLLIALEWPRLAKLSGADARRQRRRAKQKSKLRVVHPDSEEFARAVERDLAALPTIDEHDAKHS